MTSEDKAIQLVELFLLSSNKMQKEDAKQCAHIVANNIIAELKNLPGTEMRIRFYRSVKHQVELL